MFRILLVGFGLSLAIGIAACSESSSGPTGNVEIVASEDGTVEVIAQGRTLFALAATGPVARNFTEDVRGIGTLVYFREPGEQVHSLSVRSVSNEGASARVEYEPRTDLTRRR